MADRRLPADRHDEITAVWATLSRWLVVVSVAVLLTIGLAIWGFAVATTAINKVDSKAHGATITANSAETLAAQIAALTSRIATDEHRGCKIQQRGLPAGRELTGALADIHRLLTLPPTHAARLEARTIPRRELRREVRLLRDLDGHLARYAGLEAAQPRTIQC